MKNRYEIRGDITVIFLKYKEQILETSIDTKYLPLISSFNVLWDVYLSKSSNSFYVRCRKMNNGTRTTFLLARVIVNAQKGNDVDHINHDTLNNTKSNLREVTHSQNMQNKNAYKNSKSGMRGVIWHNGKSRWSAQIMSNGKYLYRKMFKNVEDAEKAVKEARKHHFHYATN